MMTPDELMNELKQARGELKRLRTDMVKFRAEERHRMKKVENIVSTSKITLVEKREIESGVFDEPEKKKVKINQESKGSLGFSPIGKISSPFLTKCGTPHQPGQLSTKSTIVLSNGKTGKSIEQRWMPKDALDGLESYSHCWIIFHFHLNQRNAKGAKSKVAPPRAGGHKVGVFASRAPYRPNAIGLSLVKILKVDHDNGQIDVENCDLVNETPILDIKPYIPSYDVPADKIIKTAEWLNQTKETVANIAFAARADRQIDELCGSEAESFRSSLTTLLRNDPRSIHRKETDSREGKDTIFFINFVKFTITVWFDQNHVEVLKVEPFYEHTN